MLLDKNNVNCIIKCTSESLGAFLVSWCRSEGNLPLQITAASTKIFIERGADWCGQGKNKYILEGCGMSTCLHGMKKWLVGPGFSSSM